MVGVKKQFVWKKSGACDYWIRPGQGPGQPDGRTEREVYLELHLSRLWGGVRYCSEVWQGHEGTGGGDKGRCGRSRDRGCPRGHGVLTLLGARGGRRGRYWQIFVGCRCSICRCLIELWGHELVPPPDLHQDNPSPWLRGQRSSPGQNEQPAADAPENVWTWSRLYSLTKILIDSNVCLSGSASDICLFLLGYCFSKDLRDNTDCCSISAKMQLLAFILESNFSTVKNQMAINFWNHWFQL